MFIEVPEDGVCYECCPVCFANIEQMHNTHSSFVACDYYCTNGHLIESHENGGCGKLKEV